MRNKTIGIIGGMGPESTSDFYLELTRMSQEKCSQRPSIIIHSLPIEFSVEEGFIKKGTGKKEFLKWLRESVEMIEDIVDFIVIPCNTAHIFIEELRKLTKKPILSITEETAKVCSENNFKKVGLLATTLTLRNKLYEKELKQFGIEMITLDKVEQKILSDIIHRIVLGEETTKDQDVLEKMVGKLRINDAESIILGCTDLQILLNKNLGIEVIDSMHTLVEATFRKLLFLEGKKLCR
ncbi:MAG: amino acid racemase [Candidatus Aenigmarchaeota archaeon]|nr:amino acid racemase [Candidatus Aenigmarchaeota archaeon]